MLPLEVIIAVAVVGTVIIIVFAVLCCVGMCKWALHKSAVATAYLYGLILLNADFCLRVRTCVDTGCCCIRYQKLQRNTTQQNIAEHPSSDRNSEQLQELNFSRDDYRSVDVIASYNYM